MFRVGSPNKTCVLLSRNYVTSCNEPTGETALYVCQYRHELAPPTHLESKAAINCPNRWSTD